MSQIRIYFLKNTLKAIIAVFVASLCFGAFGYQTDQNAMEYNSSLSFCRKKDNEKKERASYRELVKMEERLRKQFKAFEDKNQKKPQDKNNWYHWYEEIGKKEKEFKEFMLSEQQKCIDRDKILNQDSEQKRLEAKAAGNTQEHWERIWFPTQRENEKKKAQCWDSVNNKLKPLRKAIDTLKEKLRIHYMKRDRLAYTWERALKLVRMKKTCLDENYGGTCKENPGLKACLQDYTAEAKVLELEGKIANLKDELDRCRGQPEPLGGVQSPSGGSTGQR